MLKIQISAEQAIVEGGIIRNMVYFMDTEKYDMGIPSTAEMMPEVPPTTPNETTTP